MAGQTVTRFETALAPLARVDDQHKIAGRTIERVVSKGKHLIFDFSGGLHLRTHMRMNGSWHIYRPGERWQRRRSDMRIVIGTAAYVAVGFNIPVAEFLDERSLERQNELRKMGPDLLDDDFAEDEALRRIRERTEDEIANVLLNQRVMAGIGNVYKSEALYLCGIHPFTVVRDLSDGQLEKLVRVGRRLMKMNVEPGREGRETTGSLDRGQKLWVYGRGGKPCRRCGNTIAYRKQGNDARGTYWCPRCQP
jgi:endonuclease VIII